MRPDDTEPPDAATLRRQAEEILRALPARSNGSLSHDEALALVHELQVHQIELELQNEELLRTQREAEALRDRYADLYDFAPVGYFTLDGAGAIREANLAGAVQLGVERGSLIGARFATLLDSDSCPGFAAFCARVLAGGTTETYDVSFAARPGRGPWHAQLQGRADAAGAAVFLRLVVTNITERRRAEEVLRESEERYRTVVETTGEGFVIADPDGPYTFVNQRWAEMLGYPVEAILGKSSVDFTFDACVPKVSRSRTALHDGLRDQGEFRFRKKDGSVLWTRYNATPMFNEQGDHIANFVFHTDITEQKQTEEALQESEAKYREFFDYDITGDFISAFDGRILDCNPAFARMFGFASVEEARSSDITGTYATPTDRAALLDRLRRERRIEKDERFRRRRDGTMIHVVENIIGEFDGADNLVRIKGYVVDDTQRHRAEEEFRRSNEELQQFAYVASHDLQEPLRTIVSFSQLLERRCRGQLGPEADEYVAFIIEGGMRMQALIRDLLQLSRIEPEAQPPLSISAGAVVAEAVSTLEAPICEAGATLSVGPMPTVMADPRQLEQVFVNLIANAIKYRSPECPPEIRISAEPEGRFWRFAVADNGIGIEAEYFDRIFVIFQRLHTREEYEGTGIGLAVVKKIVERHGGRVRVESTPGEGSTFVFTLPAA